MFSALISWINLRATEQPFFWKLYSRLIRHSMDHNKSKRSFLDWKKFIGILDKMIFYLCSIVCSLECIDFFLQFCRYQKCAFQHFGNSVVYTIKRRFVFWAVSFTKIIILESDSDCLSKEKLYLHDFPSYIIWNCIELLVYFW